MLDKDAKGIGQDEVLAGKDTQPPSSMVRMFQRRYNMSSFFLKGIIHMRRKRNSVKDEVLCGKV